MEGEKDGDEALHADDTVIVDAEGIDEVIEELRFPNVAQKEVERVGYVEELEGVDRDQNYKGTTEGIEGSLLCEQ